MAFSRVWARAGCPVQGVVVVGALGLAGCSLVVGMDGLTGGDTHATLVDDAGVENRFDAAGAPTGFDAGSPVVVDSSAPDTSSPPVDSGADTNAPDAAEAGTGTGTGEDAATGLSFASPLQVDVSYLLSIDTVSTRGHGGTTLLPQGALTSMDTENNDLYTNGIANQNGVSGGLPSNGFFAANGTQSPAVQLHFSDGSTGANSAMINGQAPNDGSSLTFDVPGGSYSQIQLYATSTNGDTALTVTLTYSDSSTTMTNADVPDWGSGTTTSPVFVFAGNLGRVSSGSFDTSDSYSIYGVNVAPDPTRTLSSVELTTSGNGSGAFVFYGATAW